jgi:TolB-like protein
VTPEGRAKVLDFGLAKRLAPDELSEEPTRAADSLTEAGQIVGTLHYLAPEVLRGRAADTRTDVWALGVLLYELATGDRPFRGQTKFEVTSAILEQPPRPLPESVPAGLRSVIERCLAKEPGERYQRGSEVHAVLEAIQSGSFTPERTPRPKPGRRRWLLWGAAAATVLALGLVGARFFASRAQSIDSIAVLPFTNVGGDPDTEYLSDGITESVIGSLSRLPDLKKIIAFGSVLRYKGRPVDARVVARELGVTAMVIGRVTHHRDALSISAELIDTRDGSRLWGDQYEARPGAFLSVQQEISRQISDQLRSHLSGEMLGRVAKRYEGNAEAYELYLKGRYHYNKFTPEGYEKSLELYRRAIEKDPAYAPAYVGMHLTYSSMIFEGLLHPKEGREQRAVVRARVQELDPALAHVALAQKYLGDDWDWPAAEREFRKALEVDPQDVVVRRYYSQLLRILGRWDEAIAEMKRAQELDPVGVETSQGLGATYYQARRYDEAIEQFKKTLELDPRHVRVHQLLAEVYARKGMHKEAIACWQQIFILSGDEEGARMMGEDFEAGGYEEVMRSLYRGVLDSLTESAKHGYVSPVSFAVAHAKLNEKDQAFTWLEKCYAERTGGLPYVKADPDFDNLRSDPRFPALMRRIGLP